jgi:hypothetical protein
VNKVAISGFLLCILAFWSFSSFASTMGAISTDRFGYTGTVERYTSLGDAQSQSNQVGSDIEIGNRDLALYVVNDYNSYDTDSNIIMGSWYYSTEGSAGYGNTTGNSGRGYVQLYDDDGSTDTSLDMGFGGFDGTKWTEFDLSLSGTGADYPNDYARFWVDYQGSGADIGFYHSYSLALNASGLEGSLNSSTGMIEASNHPTSVTGTYSGIFENVSTTYPENNDFYVFNLALDMENWAWDNRDDLDPYEFYDSYFAAADIAPVPEPSTFLLLGSGLAGLVFYARKRKKV